MISIGFTLRTQPQRSTPAEPASTAFSIGCPETGCRDTVVSCCAL
jgi:hypothetical protein